ncbi:MAG: cytochrome c [Deltaproteobacteria bacterium]|nr:cytochrome c [Deltaproteobacteria bacterium]
MPETEDALRSGKSVYVRLCLSCHGTSGAGDGPMAKSLPHRPPDFAKVLRAQTDGEIFWKISRGGGAMPSFGKKVSEEERWQLVHFLRVVAMPGEGRSR